jgi:multiple sugar transport system substrate-binding protein
MVGSMAMMAFAQDKVEVRMTWWGSQNRHDRTIKVIEMFEEMHPEIDIVFEFSGWRDYWTKLAPQIAGGSLPDLMQHDYARMAEWVSKGLLLPLDEYVEAGILDFTNIADSAVASGRVDGKLYGLNLGNNSQAWLIDVDAFEKAGIPLPAQNWTWEDFEQITLELHDKLGIWGMGGHLDDRQIWKSLYMGYGYMPFGPDNKSLGYEDDQPLIDHLRKIILMIQEDTLFMVMAALQCHRRMI